MGNLITLNYWEYIIQVLLCRHIPEMVYVAIFFSSCFHNGKIEFLHKLDCWVKVRFYLNNKSINLTFAEQYTCDKSLLEQAFS